MCEGCHGLFCELHHTNQPSKAQWFRSSSRLSRCLCLLRITQGQEWLAPPIGRTTNLNLDSYRRLLLLLLERAGTITKRRNAPSLISLLAPLFFPLSILSGSERSATAFLPFCVERISPIKQAGFCVRRIAFLAAIPHQGFLRF